MEARNVSYTSTNWQCWQETHVCYFLLCVLACFVSRVLACHHSYDLQNMNAKPQTFQFQTITNEGWGMTYDAKKDELIVSDGSEYLLFWDPDTFQEKRRVRVQRQQGKRSNNINELEFWRDRYVIKLFETAFEWMDGIHWFSLLSRLILSHLHA